MAKPVFSGSDALPPPHVTLVKSAWVTDTDGSLLVGSDSFFPAKGNKSAQLKICLQHSLMDQGESSIVTV